MSNYQVNFKLRKLAEKMGPDQKRFSELANSVSEFTTCLLDPLRSDKDRRRQFGDDILDDILNVAIENGQKKVTLEEKSRDAPNSHSLPKNKKETVLLGSQLGTILEEKDIKGCKCQLLLIDCFQIKPTGMVLWPRSVK